MVRRIGLIKQCFQLRLVHAQVGRSQRCIVDGSAPCARELTNTVHRIVIVKCEQEPAARAKGKGLTNQLQCSRGVLGEDHDVVIRGGIEISQQVASCALDVVRHGHRCRIGRMRIAENSGTQDLRMLPHLRFAVEGTPRVVKVHLALFIEATVFSGAQRIESAGLGISGIPRQKIRVCVFNSHGHAMRDLFSSLHTGFRSGMKYTPGAAALSFWVCRMMLRRFYDRAWAVLRGMLKLPSMCFCLRSPGARTSMASGG